MKPVTTIGIDLAKNSFSVYGVDAKGKPVLSRTLRRTGVVRFFANLPSCLVGMEACSGSEYWARTIESLGHEVRRIHPRYVKAYLLGAKNDANDAAAICEAVQRPNMRFVPHKSPLQTDIQCIHRIRQRYIRSRTALINQARGLLAEYGIVVRQGAKGAARQRVPTNRRLALQYSAGKNGLKNPPAPRQKYSFLTKVPAGSFMLTNNEKNELHEISEIIPRASQGLFSSNSLFSLFSLIMLISWSLPFLIFPEQAPGNFRPAPHK